MRITKTAAIGAALVTMLVSPVCSGQIGSHIYTALRMRDHLSPKCRAIVDSNLAAYLSGAQGPDTTGVVQHGLGSLSTMPTPTVGEESHYDKTGELTLNILFSAKKDAEIAFALGWITHYLNDQYVHPVVNRYGGYYKVDPRRHKALEQLESKYVYAEKSSLVDEKTATACPADLGHEFAAFILQGYHWTFPDNHLYMANETVGVKGVYDDTRLDHFCGQFRRAASWSLEASKDFYEAHKSGKGEHNYTNTYVAGLPNMPTQAQYERIMKPIKVTVQPRAQQLAVSVVLDDDRLHGRFCKEWDEAMERCIDHGASILPEVCAYFEAKDQAERNALRPGLKPLFPNVNLDQPLASFDVSKIEPGNFSTQEIIWEYEPVIRSGSLKTDPQKVKTGKVRMEGLMDGGWEGGKYGVVEFAIPVTSDKEDYKLRIKLLPNACYEGLDYVEYDSSTKQAQVLGPGEVMLGDIFDVTFELPPNIAANPGDRRYVMMPDNETVTLEDGMLIQSSMSDKFRFDVACLEDRVEGGNLHAKLQITDLNSDKLLGRQNLTVVRFDKGKGNMDTSQLLLEAGKMLESANEAMEAVDKALNLTEEQEKQLEQEMEAYQAELDKNPKLSDKDKEQMMAAKAQEIMKRLGVDLENLLAADPGIHKVEAMGDVPFNESTKLTIRPAKLDVTSAQGWAVPTGLPPYGASVSLGKSVEEKTDKGFAYLDVEGSFGIGFSDDEEMRNTFESRPKDPNATAILVEVAGFKGTVYQVSRQNESHWQADNSNLPEGQEPDLSATASFAGEMSGSGMLVKGKVLMLVNYGVTVKASMSTDKKGNVEYDGMAAGKKEFERAETDVSAMLRSIRLSPGPLPR
jgi:hypothetical protein